MVNLHNPMNTKKVGQKTQRGSILERFAFWGPSCAPYNAPSSAWLKRA